MQGTGFTSRRLRGRTRGRSAPPSAASDASAAFPLRGERRGRVLAAEAPRGGFGTATFPPPHVPPGAPSPLISPAVASSGRRKKCFCAAKACFKRETLSREQEGMFWPRGRSCSITASPGRGGGAGLLSAKGSTCWGTPARSAPPPPAASCTPPDPVPAVPRHIVAGCCGDGAATSPGYGAGRFLPAPPRCEAASSLQSCFAYQGKQQPPCCYGAGRRGANPTWGQRWDGTPGPFRAQRGGGCRGCPRSPFCPPALGTPQRNPSSHSGVNTTVYFVINNVQSFSPALAPVRCPALLGGGAGGVGRSEFCFSWENGIWGATRARGQIWG